MTPFTPKSLGTKIALIAALVVLLVGAASFGILQRLYRQQMLDALADSTTIQGELIEQSLRHAMHTRSLDLLAEMVHSLASQKGVEKVMILDKRGVIRFSSDTSETETILARSHPTCMICHRDEPTHRGRTVIFEREEAASVFRNVNPILNSASCQPCHRPEDRVNGVLIVDYSLEETEASLAASARKMWLSAIIIVLVITIVLLVLMRRMVLERIWNLVEAINSFRLDRRVTSIPQSGSDEISHLSQHLGHMMSSLNGSFEDLRRREAYLDSVINSADDGIVVVDDELRVVKANRAYESLCGAARDDLLDSPCAEAPLCRTHCPDDCPARMTLQSGKTARRIRTVVGEDGLTRHYEISSSPLVPADRPQVLEIWRDITRRRELEAGLAHSERLASLGFLASGLSHEINNPLASITTCLDGLARRMRTHQGEIPPELPQYLQLIRNEVGRCRELSNRLRGLGKKPRPTREAVDLRRVVEETVALVRYEAQKSQVEVTAQVSSDARPILGDEAQVRQVLLNLVLNAIQAIETRGRVVVKVRVENDEVCLEVDDDGRGIPPNQLQAIFEPFYSARPNGGGSGLGLFISKVIVDRAGGSIDVISAPGRGTRFVVRWPYSAEAHADASSESGGGSVGDSR